MLSKPGNSARLVAPGSGMLALVGRNGRFNDRRRQERKTV